MRKRPKVGIICYYSNNSKQKMQLLGPYLVLCFITVALTAQLPYDTNHPHITPLNLANFAENVIQNDPIWVVEFYAPWCGHCKSFAPEFEKAAKSLEGIVRFGAVNADDKDALSYPTVGYPTVLLFPTDLVEDEDGQLIKKPIEYQQERSGKALDDGRPLRFEFPVPAPELLGVQQGATAYLVHTI